ncbi:terminase TerL endonuclease subunit [Clostridium tagluense]|uniref:terminase TerL endonuclease subunit n=1 Tax=Clostridium tagluense TaxID=360422 RepID=UPI001C6E255D|nr:terminase TerL endonuclease subunit [Clostridium tagluense]MBW9154869.1 terminase large subunit [Clostridium tagluense]WLC64324.1 terminase large subunit [Clostridium tagluense]
MNCILLERALQYANDVTEGREVTTVEVIVQCTIFLNDYHKRQHEDDFEFYFDEEECLKINNLLKLFNFATGFVEGKQVLENLAPFQCFFLANIFAWRFKNRTYKFRYNDNTLFIARKNAKTAIIGLVFLLLMLTQQKYSEFYSICLTKELASEIKKIMGQIIGASPLIKKHFTVSKPKTGMITCKLTGSFFEPRVAEAGKNNAIRSEAFVSDEHGNFSDGSNFQAMKSGQKNVMNGLVFRTTTAYEINNSIMEEDLEYIRKVLNKVVVDERQFALVYYSTEEHLWDDTGIYMANPLRIEENYETMRKDRETALEKPSTKGEYLTKTMNVFLQEKKNEAYMDIKLWKKGEVKKVDFGGQEVIVSLDGSISLDLTSVSIMYKKDNKYYTSAHSFLPQNTLGDRRERIDYYDMERKGYCTIQKNVNTIQQNLIENYIRNIEVEHNCKIKMIVADKFNFQLVLESLAKEYTVVELMQSYNTLTVATQGLKEEVYNGNVYHEKSELLDWCVSNATLSDGGKAGHVMLDKISAQKNRRRIDMCATTIFCMTELYIPNNTIDINKVISSGGWKM